ncbi:NADH-quinone oxidoreductase subunit 12 [Calidithermus terrae]|uniref:NADH-quinone oxidoreductase subunit 12 n=1 Tax=Calidithermus terrae TaxID=1408545 RepID=A0A399ESM8_9DEIN|nr:NADH-quinone oxidoreductase subunit L [Calidithermus terrae]RIH86805.1 NADH-quinone oxidoreductase subunit 12 [Calidithermus terrae]
MQETVLLPLIILLPLLGFAVLGLWGKRMHEPTPGVVASALVLGSFVLGVVLLAQGGARWGLEDWLPGIPLFFALDNLSGLMVMIVAGIGFLIHVYAIGYMHGDAGFSRFFSYFNLFIAAMLVLVLGDSLPVVFIGWEGVGLASYLLIGFWYADRVNGDSARKAFIVNRIGDLGFLLGMGVLWANFGTLSISELREAIAPEGELAVGLNNAALALAAFLLFVGAIGKSAQVPLMVWLPDAMAGPTPVSALIHAATMVTAGVYLLCRNSFLYFDLPDVSFWIVLIGTITAVYGALCAFGQTDIKRIVAYSTLSQLGFMFVAAGVGAYWVAMFHVMTHAFFKALLFMSSGSVIHALGGEQDVRKMGGMWNYLPQTRIHGLVGALALGGLPLLSGFWSKDAILAYSYEYSPAVWFVMLLVAALTALYSMRWFVLVFLGKYRGHEHPHESPSVMTWPNHVLTLGSLFAGFVGLPYVIQYKNFLEPWLNKVIVHHEHEKLPVMEEWTLILVSAAVAVGALYYGYRFFQAEAAGRLPAWFARFQEASLRSFYADDVYNALIVKPLKSVAKILFDADNGVLTGFQWLGSVTGTLGGLLARLETGYLRFYAAGLLVAAVLLILVGVIR